MLLTQEVSPKRNAWPLIAGMTLECGIVVVALFASAFYPATLKLEASAPAAPLFFRKPPPEHVKLVKATTSTGPSDFHTEQTSAGPKRPPKIFQIPTGKGDLNRPTTNVIFADGPEFAPPSNVTFGDGNGPNVPTTFEIASIPPPPAPAPKTVQRVTVGGRVEPPSLVAKIDPPYPSLAKASRVQGTVKLEAVISTTGTIMNLRVVSGHPLLIDAAMNAVRQWRYQPTRLNGVPVEVSTMIDVNFTLRQ